MSENEPVIGPLASSPAITRHPGNPILTADDVPYPATLVFNAGVCKFDEQYVMVFRNDFGPGVGERLTGTNLGLARSWDGLNFQVEPEPCFELHDAEISRAYDPRLTVIDGRCYLCFAVDTAHGIRGGIAVTDDFESFDVLSLSTPDNRNMVLFPELIDGLYVRLERPFPVYGRYGRNPEQFDIWISDSPDLCYWGSHELLLGAEQVPFCNRKIGPGPPPVRTEAGWLAAFHAVDVNPEVTWGGWDPGAGATWQKRYTVGLLLLDIENPYRLIGMSRRPLLVPEARYELEGGYRNGVIFPGGMILEDDGEVKLYYGAADAVMCLATAHVDDLVGLCLADGDSG